MKLIEYFEKGAPIDSLKPRKGAYRAWDHQLLQEMYTLTPKKTKVDNKWDFMQLGAVVPGPSESLEVLAPTMQENACKFQSQV